MMTGLRLGVGRAIIGMVVAEFFTAITGLGALIVKYGNQYDTASMFVPIFVLMFLGVTLSMIVRSSSSRLRPGAIPKSNRPTRRSDRENSSGGRNV